MPKMNPRVAMVIAATAAAGLSGVAISGAASSPSATATPDASHRDQRGGGGETALTGETKTKVEAAALAEVPGTVIRTETDRGGVYESHIRKSDGTEVEVKVDKAFTVTAVDTAPAGGRGGPGGRHDGGPHGDVAAIAKDLGVTSAKLRSALDAARPAADATKGDRRDDGAAAIAKSLGESTADVQAVLDANRPDGGGGGHGPGRGDRDDSALVAALAKRFSVTEAKAQAAVDAAEKAHEADHQARETAMYAAVAKALGKDAAAVQKAFEAHR